MPGITGEHVPLWPGVHIRDELPAGIASLKTLNGLEDMRLNVGDEGLVEEIWIPASHAGSGTICRPGLGGVELTTQGLFEPCHGGWIIDSSQSVFIRGVRAVGELSGGVTGALIEPPWIISGGRCGRLFEWLLEVEKVWSQGRMGVASTPLFTMLLECGRNGEDAPLGNEEEVGLALYDARGLG